MRNHAITSAQRTYKIQKNITGRHDLWQFRNMLSARFIKVGDARKYY
jgi:hypothetical protein